MLSSSDAHLTDCIGLLALHGLGGLGFLRFRVLGSSREIDTQKVKGSSPLRPTIPAFLERRGQRLARQMNPRPDRPYRDAEDFGDLVVA